MANVEYKNMTDGVAKNGAVYLECLVGALNVGDVVIKECKPSVRPGRAVRGTPKTTIETYIVTGFGGEFYSSILEGDAVRAYCEKTVRYEDYVG